MDQPHAALSCPGLNGAGEMRYNNKTLALFRLFPAPLYRRSRKETTALSPLYSLKDHALIKQVRLFLAQPQKGLNRWLKT